MWIPKYLSTSSGTIETALRDMEKLVEKELTAFEAKGEKRLPANPVIANSGGYFHVVVALIIDENDQFKKDREGMMAQAKMMLGSINCTHDAYGIIEKAGQEPYTGCLQCGQPI